MRVNLSVQRHHFGQVCVAAFLRYSVLTLPSFFVFSLHVAVGPVRTMELVYHTTRRTAMCAFARRNTQEIVAKQVRKVFTHTMYGIMALSTKIQHR